MMISKSADDPRLQHSGFDEVLAALAPMVRASAMSRQRFFHATATTLRGSVRVLDDPDIPAHCFFRPGRKFGVLARYGNGFGNDDVAPAVRGLTLRLMDAVKFTDPTDGMLDLLLNTGECFFVPTAAAFVQSQHPGPQRDALLHANPHYRDVIWRSVRRAMSFATYRYHSQAPTCFIADNGVLYFARYRVVPGPQQGGTWDGSAADPAGRWMPPHPPEVLRRDLSDRRPRSYLHDDLRYRVSVAPVRSVLQIQLHPDTDRESTLDATRPWTTPWTDLAEVTLESLVDNDLVEGLRFSPAAAPPELGIALAESPDETASLNHLRALVYQLAAEARTTT